MNPFLFLSFPCRIFPPPIKMSLSLAVGLLAYYAVHYYPVRFHQHLPCALINRACWRVGVYDNFMEKRSDVMVGYLPREPFIGKQHASFPAHSSHVLVCQRPPMRYSSPAPPCTAPTPDPGTPCARPPASGTRPSRPAWRLPCRTDRARPCPRPPPAP